MPGRGPWPEDACRRPGGRAHVRSASGRAAFHGRRTVDPDKAGATHGDTQTPKGLGAGRGAAGGPRAPQRAWTVALPTKRSPDDGWASCVRPVGCSIGVGLPARHSPRSNAPWARSGCGRCASPVELAPTDRTAPSFSKRRGPAKPHNRRRGGLQSTHRFA